MIHGTRSCACDRTTALEPGSGPWAAVCERGSSVVWWAHRLGAFAHEVAAAWFGGHISEGRHPLFPNHAHQQRKAALALRG